MADMFLTRKSATFYRAYGSRAGAAPQIKSVHFQSIGESILAGKEAFISHLYRIGFGVRVVTSEAALAVFLWRFSELPQSERVVREKSLPEHEAGDAVTSAQVEARVAQSVQV